MKFADAFAELANLFVDVVAPIIRVAHVVIDLHGFRADAVQNFDVFIGVKPAFDPKNNASLFRLRCHGLEPADDFLNTWFVASQIAVAEKCQ